MQVHPTRTSVDLAVAGILVMAAGVLLQQAAIVAWGGALLVGLAVARGVTRLSVGQIRAAGFEMLWKEEPRYRRIARGESVELVAEIRNRDRRAARFVELRPVCSPWLDVQVEPPASEVPASGRLRVVVTVRANRVGRHGIHGLSLEVQGNPGLFEVPLTFANPFGIEVLPRRGSLSLRSARGGRSRMGAHAGRPGPFSGDGSELRELREHQPGDPFKRIAWKASARRGHLLVRDFEREERDVVWLLLDASVELWSGEPGTAPLDQAIDQVAAVAQRHLAQGDRVGLAVVASRRLAWLPPDRGPAQEIEICSVLAQATSTIDADRSDLDEAEVAARVLEHMRPLDPASARRVRSTEFDRIARRADRLRARAPMTSREPYAPTARERALRRYLEAFGIGSPPRMEAERPRTDSQLADALRTLRTGKGRPSVIYMWSPAPDPTRRAELHRALKKHPRRRIDLRWITMDPTASLPSHGSLEHAMAFAVAERAQVARARGERALRRFGVKVERLRPPPRSARPFDAPGAAKT
jgi:uncharacterized protein (DUF58 family)